MCGWKAKGWQDVCISKKVEQVFPLKVEDELRDKEVSHVPHAPTGRWLVVKQEGLTP